MAEERRPYHAVEAKGIRRFPAYLVSILLIFLAPATYLLAKLWKRVPKRPFLLTVGLVAFIGWAWSWTLSFNGWWSFGDAYMLGKDVVPYLPVEEFLFYPLGGALSILFYLRWYGNPGKPWLYWLYLSGVTAFFAYLTWRGRTYGPYYLWSQFLVFNGGCCMLLAPWAASRLDLRALSVPVVLLGLAGYLWDHVGFKYRWWAFHATVHVDIGWVPIDDFNFFFFAPPAAISIYHVFCRLCGVPPLLEDRDGPA